MGAIQGTRFEPATDCFCSPLNISTHPRTHFVRSRRSKMHIDDQQRENDRRAENDHRNGKECGWKFQFNQITQSSSSFGTFLSICDRSNTVKYRLPMIGTDVEVGGVTSATIPKNTVTESRFVVSKHQSINQLIKKVCLSVSERQTNRQTNTYEVWFFRRIRLALWSRGRCSTETISTEWSNSFRNKLFFVEYANRNRARRKAHFRTSTRPFLRELLKQKQQQKMLIRLIFCIPYQRVPTRHSVHNTIGPFCRHLRVLCRQCTVEVCFLYMSTSHTKTHYFISFISFSSLSLTFR